MRFIFRCPSRIAPVFRARQPSKPQAPAEPGPFGTPGQSLCEEREQRGARHEHPAPHRRAPQGKGTPGHSHLTRHPPQPPPHRPRGGSPAPGPPCAGGRALPLFWRLRFNFYPQTPPAVDARARRAAQSRPCRAGSSAPPPSPAPREGDGGSRRLGALRSRGTQRGKTRETGTRCQPPRHKGAGPEGRPGTRRPRAAPRRCPRGRLPRPGRARARARAPQTAGSGPRPSDASPTAGPAPAPSPRGSPRSPPCRGPAHLLKSRISLRRAGVDMIAAGKESAAAAPPPSTAACTNNPQWRLPPRGAGRAAGPGDVAGSGGAAEPGPAHRTAPWGEAPAQLRGPVSAPRGTPARPAAKRLRYRTLPYPAP